MSTNTATVLPIDGIITGRPAELEVEPSKLDKMELDWAQDPAKVRTHEDVREKSSSHQDLPASPGGNNTPPAPPLRSPPRGSEEADSKTEKLKRAEGKFKCIARILVRNMALTKGLVQTAEEHMKMYKVPTSDEDEPEILTFNVQSFFPECQSCGGLSTRVKMILTKMTWSRTDEELQIVRQFVMKLTCFNRYSVYVRHELARVLFYNEFEKGRVVIRQGDVGYCFYLIVSGSVLVEIQDKDTIFGVVRNNIVGELGPGSTFGDLALLNDDKRRATIVCKEHCEFLIVDKVDFNKILKESCKQEWSQSRAILCNHPLFRDWSKENLKVIVEGSHFVEFTSNSVVLKHLSKFSDSVYIVTRGKCQVVQKVTLLVSKVDSRKRRQQQSPKFSLPPIEAHSTAQRCGRDSQQQLSSHDDGGTCNKKRSIKKWWSLRTLYPGDYFGMGEGPKDSTVICSDMAECLLVNSMLLAKHEQGRYLQRITKEAEQLYPSINAALESYVQMKQWTKYRERVVREVVSDVEKRRSRKL